jgi:hypothetical protein
MNKYKKVFRKSLVKFYKCLFVYWFQSNELLLDIVRFPLFTNFCRLLSLVYLILEEKQKKVLSVVLWKIHSNAYNKTSKDFFSEHKMKLTKSQSIVNVPTHTNRTTKICKISHVYFYVWFSCALCIFHIDR